MDIFELDSAAVRYVLRSVRSVGQGLLFESSYNYFLRLVHSIPIQLPLLPYIAFQVWYPEYRTRARRGYLITGDLITWAKKIRNV